MVDLTRENYLTNAKLLLNGLWYADLPNLLDIEELEEAIADIFDEINFGNVAAFKQAPDNFILDCCGIVSPPILDLLA